MSCPGADPSLDICPTQAQILPQLLVLLPPGRAFARPDGALPLPGSGIYEFWNAVALEFEFINQRICDMREEFWCATHKETDDLWMAEYGLPDGCDPFPDLCVKVKALGGATCDYYQGLAAELGWSIACIDNCTLDAGCIEAGMTCGLTYPPATLLVLVDLPASPAFSGNQAFGPVAGFLEAGMPISCGPDLTALDCLLQRVVHAENDIVYVPIPLPSLDFSDADDSQYLPLAA